jgi:PQQ-like domain
LRIADDVEELLCSYCGKPSRVQKRSRVLQVPQRLPLAMPHMPPLVAQQRVSWAAFVPLVIIPVAVGAGVLYSTMLLRRSPSVASAPSTGAGPVAAKDATSWAGFVPVTADVDGDGVDDFIGLSRNVLDGDRAQLAAYSGKTGASLWSGPRLGTYGEMVAGVIAVRGDRVLIATPDGSIHGFDRATGATQWTVQIGEKVERMCSGPGADQVIVLTADDSAWLLDRDGNHSKTTKPLRFDRPHEFHNKVLARFRAVGVEAPADLCVRIDNHTWDGPVGLLTISNWTTLPTVRGMYVKQLVRRPGGPVVAIGYKSPGTQVPMLAALDGDRTRWAVEVPVRDPLNTYRDDNNTALSATGVYAIYQPGGASSSSWLSGFSLDDGHRLWDVEVTGDGMATPVSGVITSGDAVVVSTWSGLIVVDQATGVVRMRVGWR